MPNAKRAAYKMLFRSKSTIMMHHCTDAISTISTNTRNITITEVKNLMKTTRWVQWRDRRATVGRLAR